MSKLYFTVQGEGPEIVLLHGFPFNHSIWKNFAKELSTSFKVYVPDLPGFGKSSLPQTAFSLDDIAGEVLAWMAELQISNPVVIGHSLGGYVTLAMLDQQPENIAAAVLFHSTAYADSKEKKESRNKVLEFINKNGVDVFTSNFIEPLFTDPAHSAIPFVKSIASQAEAVAVEGYIKAMRDRHDRIETLKKFNKRVLFLAGKNDGGIPLGSLAEQAAVSPYASLEILEKSAHMGMFEEEPQALKTIRAFVERKSVTNT